MKIALVAPPFIAVPPKKYGGTELFIAELVNGLKENGINVVLYTNGESTAPVECRYIFQKEDWPAELPIEHNLKQLSHASWAIKDAAGQADLIHVNSAPAVACSRFVDAPFVCTIHHTYDTEIAKYYAMLPTVNYIAISDAQRRRLPMPKMRTIHHGIDLSVYPFQQGKEPYLSFLGRIAPAKGTHLAIEIAKRAGIPLKIAGDIQAEHQKYWETEIRPHVDGRFIEYLGRLAFQEKNELLGNSLAMLFPVQWDEPFGLVMIEAMACGTPVLALPGGAVAEVVREGVSGNVRGSAADLVECARNLKIPATTVRAYAEEFFSVQRMTRDYISLYSEILRDGVAEREQIVA
jgi:glycosyltransferase involved in cell wall biosynthesis